MAIALPPPSWPLVRGRITKTARSIAATITARVRVLSRLTRVRLGYAAGLAVTAWGVGVLFGFGWALITGGLSATVSFLLLVDVDSPP